MNETPRHQRAFETFFGLGTQRTLGALAELEGISLASAKLWSRTFNWAGRVAERDAALAAAVEEKTARVSIDRHTRNRKILEAGILRGARAVADGEVKPSLADIARFMTLEAELAAAPDTREALERELRAKTPEELRAVALAHLRELASMLGKTAVVELLDRPEAD